MKCTKILHDYRAHCTHRAPPPFPPKKTKWIRRWRYARSAVSIERWVGSSDAEKNSGHTGPPTPTPEGHGIRKIVHFLLPPPCRSFGKVLPAISRGCLTVGIVVGFGNHGVWQYNDVGWM